MKCLLALVLVVGALAAPGVAAADAADTEVRVSDAGGRTTVFRTNDPAARSRATSSSEGCRTVDVAHVGRDIFGFVVYKFHQRNSWCPSWGKAVALPWARWAPSPPRRRSLASSFRTASRGSLRLRRCQQP